MQLEPAGVTVKVVNKTNRRVRTEESAERNGRRVVKVMADPADTNALVIRPHPFSMDSGVIQVKAGQTLQAMLDGAAQGREIAATLRVEIGGIEVPRSLWARVRPKEGTAIHATVMPAGGGSGKKWLRTILLIVVMVVAWYVAPMLAGSAATVGLWQAGIMMVGQLLINALVPPPKPPSMGAASDAGRFNMLTGSSNQANPYGAIPLVLGECKVFPPHAAIPYSESVGQVSYQRLMFDLGHGEVTANDIKIGETPIEEFEEVEFEITRTPTLYTNDIAETGVSAAMNDGDSVTRTTAPNVDEISLDIVFQQGLFGMDKKGKVVSAQANIKIEYREVGSGTWLAAPLAGAPTAGVMPRRIASAWDVIAASMIVKTPDRKPFAASSAWGVPKGQYEVRITRSATSWGSAEASSRIGDATWSVLRSIRHTDPSNTGTTKLCMRIKASEQLNGTLSTLSCVVRQLIPVYDRATATWSAPVFNMNPAWVYHWLLTSCPAVSTHVAPARVDLENLADFAEFCIANDFETRGCQDARTIMRALIDDVLACALGAVSQRDGKYGVVFDSGDTVPTMVFTPLDTKSFGVSRVFSRLPHALRVKFRNPNANWETDEIIVLDDGYSYRGVDARGTASADPEPTLFESLDLRMVSDPHSAWRIGRHHFAQAKFRPNTYAWETDIANLACTRGDVVHVAHDVTEWGSGWGRVVSLVGATLVLDETVECPAGVSYSVRIRRQDGTSDAYTCTPHSVATSTFYLDTTPVGVSVGDVATLGETTRETVKLLISGIMPSADLGATMRAVAYDERVAPFWADPPAVIVSEVSGTAFTDPPPAPNITVIVSDGVSDNPDDGGTTEPEVHINIQPRSGYIAPRTGGRISTMER